MNKIIKGTKNEYYKRKIEQSAGSIKKLYQIVNEATNVDKSHSLLACIKYNNEMITKSKQVSDICNEYFTSIGKSMAETLPEPENPFKIENMV